MALEINNSNYAEIIESGKPVVLDFWATWCVPCRVIAPHIDELANIYGDKVIVGKVNMDGDSDELAAKYGIRNIPTVLFIKDGQVLDKQVGAASKSVYVSKIESLLS
ncbi:MAG: thioredoxin [Prevotellaceae bacterium]|jgi:thioredoxin 1|nr:thioredoxin [Prevotellaceae bacterium]